MTWTILLPFLFSAAAWPLHRVLRDRVGFVLAALPLGLFMWLAGHLPLPLGQVVAQSAAWVPSLDVHFALRLDGLSITFALLITGIGTLVVLYAQGYLKGDPGLGRFYAYLLAFMGAMLGVVLADDLVLLFVFWELTSVCSYLLIGWYHEKEGARSSALRALVVTGAGGLALLGGVILVGIMHARAGAAGADVWRISALASVDLRGDPLYPAALALVLVGAFTKSAQFPFHFWLPSAMTAPTPVSSYLHSATMVKAGIYLLARLHPALGGTPLWHYAVTIGGAVTMVTAAIAAACQTDLKRMLAFSTVSVLGTLVMLLGPGTDECIRAAVILLVAHAMYKAALFMVAGNIDHETGTRDVHALGGLRRWMPLTAAAGVLAALSNAGAPPMFGFLGKELLYTAKLDLARLGHDLVFVAVLANIFLTAVALVVAVWPFFGPRKKTPKEPHEAPWTMLAGPLLLAVASLFVGLASGPFALSLGQEMASVIAGRDVPLELKLWHGLNPEALTVLGLSAVTLGLGFALFLRLRTWLAPLAALHRRAEATWGPPAIYERALSGLSLAAKGTTALLQTGYLRRYLAIVVLGAAAFVLPSLVRGLPAGARDPGVPPTAVDIALGVLILGGAVSAALSRSRLAALAALGATGLGMSLLFALHSAPDLAITQFLVEALSVILLVLVFWKLPPYRGIRSTPRRLGDLALALAGGAVMALLVLIASRDRVEPVVGRWYSDASVPEAKGRNVVNVILVDFRALDTLGEITVVAVAGVGVVALLRGLARRRPEASRPGGES